MIAWDMWKRGFTAWETATAEYLEQMLKRESVLAPAGIMLSVATKSKAAMDKVMAAWWSAWGLPTKHDQERSLHKLNQLESRLLDLEERIAELSSRGMQASSAAPGSPGRHTSE